MSSTYSRRRTTMDNGGVDSRHGLHSYRVLELDVAGYSSKHLSDRFEVHFHKWSIGYYRTGHIWPSIDGQWCAEGIIITVMMMTMTMAMTMIAGGSCNGSHQRSTLLNSSCLWLSKGEQKASLWNPLFIAACCCVWLLFFLVAVLQTTDRQLTDWQMCVQCQSVLTLFATCSTLHVNNCTFRCHFNTHFTNVQCHNREGWYLSQCYRSPGKYFFIGLYVNWLRRYRSNKCSPFDDRLWLNFKSVTRLLNPFQNLFLPIFRQRLQMFKFTKRKSCVF